MKRLIGAFMVGCWLAAACGGPGGGGVNEAASTADARPAQTQATATSAADGRPGQTQAAAIATAAAATLATATVSPADDVPPRGAEAEFTTDFNRHTVPYTQIISGGPGKDGIPAIDAPRFVTTAEAEAWLSPVEPVIRLEINGETRAYPLQVLIWHEIVNDTVGGVPVVVTFCPLCNTAIVFERAVGERVLDFGTTGRLRYGNLIMYDRQTETWWQQANGEAIAGEQTGTRLALRPATIIGWGDFKAAHTAGLVLSRETGFNRPYGRNPYVGYDDVNMSPFVHEGWLAYYRGPKPPETLPPGARVLTVALGDEAVAYPYEVLLAERAVNDRVGGEAIVVVWAAGTASALDTRVIAEGRDVGAAAAFGRTVAGQTLTFRLVGERVLDDETGSEWNVLGQAVAGPLAGQQLQPVASINHFWFSWAAFRPDTRIYWP